MKPAYRPATYAPAPYKVNGLTAWLKWFSKEHPSPYKRNKRKADK